MNVMMEALQTAGLVEVPEGRVDVDLSLGKPLRIQVEFSRTGEEDVRLELSGYELSRKTIVVDLEEGE